MSARVVAARAGEGAVLQAHREGRRAVAHLPSCGRQTKLVQKLVQILKGKIGTTVVDYTRVRSGSTVHSSVRSVCVRLR